MHNLAHNLLESDSLRLLTTLPLTKLKSLWLSFNKIGPKGIQFLS
jgi:hypothetical protein